MNKSACAVFPFSTDYENDCLKRADSINDVHNVTYIYELIDPRNNQTRYIGKSNNPKERLTGHCVPVRLISNTHKTNWIKSLLKLGLRPILNVIDEVPLIEWQFWEVYYISLYKSWGFKLTNGSDGGEGSTNDIKKGKPKGPMSQKTKDKMRIASKGKKKSKQHCINISKGSLGKTVKESTKKKLQLKRLGKTFEELFGEEKSKQIKRKCSICNKFKRPVL